MKTAENVTLLYMILAFVRRNCWVPWRKKKIILGHLVELTYSTSARKVRLNTSGCDSRWALTSKFRLLTLPTLLPFTSVFSRSKPTRQATTLFRHKQNHWLRSESKRETRNQFSEIRLSKRRCPLRRIASMKQVYQHLPSKEADCNQNDFRRGLPNTRSRFEKSQILCKDKVHISILCCSSDICAFTGRFFITIQ
jgi:hypothetical protein